METLRHVIKFFLKIAVAFFLLAVVWGLMSLLLPGLNFRTLIPTFGSTSTSTDKNSESAQGWLPSPRAYSGLFAKKGVQNEYTNVYVSAAPYNAGAPYNGYGNIQDGKYTYSTASYVTYTATGTAYTGDGTGLYKAPSQSGTSVITPTGSGSGVVTGTQTTSATFNRNQYVRNLSIYEGGHIYTGLAFIGETKSSMFKQGKFPIVVVDATGKVIGVSAAVATSDWSIPGWTRFETKINYVLPNNAPCTMVFEEALLPTERTRMPMRIPLQVRCN